MRHSLIAVACVLAVGFAAASVSGAGVITLQEAADLDALPGSGWALVGSVMETGMSGDGIATDVFSGAYINDLGEYAYLYQVDNTGETGYSAVEMFTLWPFACATDDATMGWLVDAPTGFLTDGGLAPESTGYVDNTLTGGPLVEFYYTRGARIGTGNHSLVMYVLSECAPDEVPGKVTGGTTTGSGDVVGPIPEPGTWMLLASGLAVLVVYRRRRRA